MRLCRVLCFVGDMQHFADDPDWLRVEVYVTHRLAHCWLDLDKAYRPHGWLEVQVILSANPLKSEIDSIFFIAATFRCVEHPAW